MTMPPSSTPAFSRKAREILNGTIQPVVVIVFAMMGVLVLLAVTGYDPAKAVDAMGRSLGLHLIAEGVETPGQLAFLRKEGCDEMQGFLVSRPLPADELERALLR